jgi:hypothetical protein
MKQAKSSVLDDDSNAHYGLCDIELKAKHKAKRKRS